MSTIGFAHPRFVKLTPEQQRALLKFVDELADAREQFIVDAMIEHTLTGYSTIGPIVLNDQGEPDEIARRTLDTAAANRVVNRLYNSERDHAR